MAKPKKSTKKPGKTEIPALDHEQMEALTLAPNFLHPHLKSLLPFLESVRKANSKNTIPYRKDIPTHQATDFKISAVAAKALGVDFKDDNVAYNLNLKVEHLQSTAQLSEHFGLVIHDLKNSDYVGLRRNESFCRTILDLIIVDHLDKLEDKDAFRRLQLAAEVPISVRIKDIYGNPAQ